MKLFAYTLLTIFACTSHAQQTTEPLPVPGDTAPMPTIDKPVQDPKEFNQDIDDFEKKISKEVPPEKAGAPKAAKGAAPAAKSVDNAADKARAQMKKQLNDDAGEAKSGIAKHKEAAAAKHAHDKKAKKAAKKSAAAKKPSKKKKSQ